MVGSSIAAISNLTEACCPLLRRAPAWEKTHLSDTVISIHRLVTFFTWRGGEIVDVFLSTSRDTSD